MTREELLRVLSFVDATRELSEKRTALSAPDPRWNIVSYAMRRHLEGRLITMTSLAMAADVPYGTAIRRINELTEEGYLLRRPRSRTGKSFSLHPTRKLIAEFESYALQLKALVGNTFGFTTGDTPIEEFFFGGYYMASRILSYPNAMREGVGFDRTVRILAPVDPTFRMLADVRGELKQLCGTNVEVVNLPLDALHGEIIADAARDSSAYHLVAIDLPWIGELAEAGIIRPLDGIIREARYNASDFHSAAWRGSAWRGVQYALPIQPTPELMFCRRDLFAEAGLALPETTEDVLLAARTLHRAQPGLSGIVMNYGPGTPVAHSFVQTMADFGQPVIDLAPLGADFDASNVEGEQFRPMIDTPGGRAAAEYLLELMQFAHPESLQCNWDRRIAIFARGAAAMTYGWSIRAAAFELDTASPAHGKVEFLPHPPGPGCKAVSPIGGFSLAVPARLPEAQVETAWRVMEYLTRPEMMKWYVQNGNLTSPRFSTSADPEVQAKSALIGRVDAMERRGVLQLWPRPPIPEFSDLLGILGRHVHALLSGTTTTATMLATAQAEADALMRDRGRY